jgi:hypothetical protein
VTGGKNDALCLSPGDDDDDDDDAVIDDDGV